MPVQLAPGINHLEIWVSDFKRSQEFYNRIFALTGWKEIREGGWSNGQTEIYLREESSTSRVLSLGVHHLCLQATSREVVDEVCRWLISQHHRVFAGPISMENYSAGYYTCDFYDPDGMILEVAYTPNMVV
ncbi:VOC family protein [Patescibacteria group bacterium]|nr:VOC family protein [Patescibacteria group bacterium]